MAVNANVGGSVSGQLTIGDHNVQLRADGGTLVYVAPPAPPRAQPRPRPVVLRPRKPANFVDRTTELATVVRALGTGPALIELSGAPGVGKTALLRTVAYDATMGRFAGGVVYLAQADGPFEDVLFEVGDALFAFEGGYVPTHVQLRHLLVGADALLLLDDLEAERADVEQLFDAVSDASVVYATSAPRGLDSTVRVGLGVLPTDLLQTAGIGPPATPAALAGLSDAERAVMAVLALVPADRIPMSVLIEVAGRPDAAAAIASLAHRRLVESEARSEEAVRLAPDVAALREARAFAGTGASPRRLLTALIEGVRSAVEVRRRAAPIEHLASAVLASGDARMVLWLAQTFGEYLAAAGALGRWERLLGLGLNAARTLGDRAAEGWALHQLGTRALLVGDRVRATALLRQALSVRTAIGDGTGIRATQHNLDVLLGIPPPPPQRPVRATGGGGDFPVGMLAFVAVIVIAAVIALGVMLYRSGALPGATPAPFASESPSPSPSPEATPSPIPLVPPTLTPEPSATPASPSPSPTDAASPSPSASPPPVTATPNAGATAKPTSLPSATPAATAAPTATATAAPRPLSIEAAGSQCATGPGVRYAINGGATSLVIAGTQDVPVVIPSPPPEGCVALGPGRYMLRAVRDGKAAIAFAFVRAPSTPVPTPSPTPNPTPPPLR